MMQSVVVLECPAIRQFSRKNGCGFNEVGIPSNWEEYVKFLTVYMTPGSFYVFLEV